MTDVPKALEPAFARTVEGTGIEGSLNGPDDLRGEAGDDAMFGDAGNDKL
jgi:hypothetical protein